MALPLVCQRSVRRRPERGSGKTQVACRICTARAYYIKHLYDLFQDFAGTPPRVQNIRGGGARDRQCIRFKTYSHLWSPSGFAPPLVGVALRAPYGLGRASGRLWGLWSGSGLGSALGPLVYPNWSTLNPLVYFEPFVSLSAAINLAYFVLWQPR